MNERGQAAEARALAWLQARGWLCLARNYRCRQGEIDLIMQDGDTVVFVEVRQRRSARFGGAAASVGTTKQRRIVFAARHYLLRLRTPPPCRFDVVLVEDQIAWLQAAFDAS